MIIHIMSFQSLSRDVEDSDVDMIFAALSMPPFQSLSRDVEDSDAVAAGAAYCRPRSNPSAGMLRILTHRYWGWFPLWLCSNPSAGMLRILTRKYA